MINRLFVKRKKKRKRKKRRLRKQMTDNTIRFIDKEMKRNVYLC